MCQQIIYILLNLLLTRRVEILPRQNGKGDDTLTEVEETAGAATVETEVIIQAVEMLEGDMVGTVMGTEEVVVMVAAAVTVVVAEGEAEVADLLACPRKPSHCGLAIFIQQYVLMAIRWNRRSYHALSRESSRNGNELIFDVML